MNEDKNQEEYNLYTEKIVEPKHKKRKKVLKGIKTIMYVIALSVLAAVVFFSVNSFLSKMTKKGENEKESKPIQLNLPTDNTQTGEKPEDSTDSSQSGTDKNEDPAKQEIADYKQFYNTAVNVSNQVYPSLVKVSALVDTSNIFDVSYETQTIGAVVVATDDTFYVVTKYDVIKNADRINVILYTGETCSANLINGDEITNIAIVTISKDSMDSTSATKLKAVAMGNSSFVETGEPLIAVGNICNGYFTMNYGVASNIKNVIYDIDSKYGIINTNIVCGENVSGILVDVSGRLMGIITDNYTNEYGDMLISAYGISDMKAVIEQLSNGKTIPYVGIEGREVTTKISEAYGMPKGICITNIRVNSPAYLLGLQSGDIITQIEGEEILDFAGFQKALFANASNENVTITVARKGKGGYKKINYNLEIVEQ